jgi:hypothetical protein
MNTSFFKTFSLLFSVFYMEDAPFKAGLNFTVQLTNQNYSFDFVAYSSFPGGYVRLSSSRFIVEKVRLIQLRSSITTDELSKIKSDHLS